MLWPMPELPHAHELTTSNYNGYSTFTCNWLGSKRPA